MQIAFIGAVPLFGEGYQPRMRQRMCFLTPHFATPELRARCFKIGRTESLTPEVVMAMGLFAQGPDLNAGNTRFLNQTKE